MPLRHLALAFVIAHPGVTAALIGPRTMDQLADLLGGSGVVLTDDVLEQIDEIVPPGTDVGRLDMAYQSPAVTTPALRRRPVGERGAARGCGAVNHFHSGRVKECCGQPR